MNFYGQDIVVTNFTDEIRSLRLDLQKYLLRTTNIIQQFGKKVNE